MGSLPVLALLLSAASLFTWSALLGRSLVRYKRERRHLILVMYLTGFLAAAGMFGSAVGFSVSSGLWSPDFALQLQTAATFLASAGRAALLMAGVYLLMAHTGRG